MVLHIYTGVDRPPDALARTKWSTWMQVKQSEGFFEVWNGTPEEIRKLAEAKR